MDKLDMSGALHQERLADAFDALINRIECMTLSKAGLKIGVSSKAKVEVANDTYYMIGGVMKMIDADDEIAFTAGDDITANAAKKQEKVYMMVSDGTTVSMLDSVQADEGESVLPEIPANNAVIGTITVVLKAGSTDFDAGTTLLDDAAIDSVTYSDYGFLSPEFGTTK